MTANVEFVCLCGKVATVAPGRVKTCVFCGLGFGLSEDGASIGTLQTAGLAAEVMSLQIVERGNRYISTGITMRRTP